MATTDEIGAVWRMLKASYPNFVKERGAAELTETLDVYRQLLQDVPFDVLKLAVLQHVASSKWFPTIAELREKATAIAAPQLTERTGIEAWGIVLDTFMDGRYYRFEDGHEVTPTFDDPLIRRMIASMGGYWHAYNSHRSQEGNPVADRARFIEGYEQLRRRERDDALLLPATRTKRAELEAARNAPALTDGRAVDDTAEKISDVIGRVLPMRKVSNA